MQWPLYRPSKAACGAMPNLISFKCMSFFIDVQISKFACRRKATLRKFVFPPSKYWFTFLKAQNFHFHTKAGQFRSGILVLLEEHYFGVSSSWNESFQEISTLNTEAIPSICQSWAHFPYFFCCPTWTEGYDNEAKKKGRKLASATLALALAKDKCVTSVILIILRASTVFALLARALESP